MNYEQGAHLSRKIIDDLEQFYSTSYDYTKKDIHYTSCMHSH